MSEPAVNRLEYASDAPRPWQDASKKGYLQWLSLKIAHAFEGLLLLGGITALLGIAFGGPGPGMLSITTLLIASIGAAAASNARRFRAFRIMSYLQQALRANLPLAPMMRSAAIAERGAMRQRLETLQFHLYDGAPLAESLAAAVPEFSDRPLTLIHTAESNGQLPRVIDGLIAEHQQFTAHTIFRSAIYRVYLVFILLGLGGTALMLNTFVMPKFQQIFKDFQVPPPAPMQSYLRYSAAMLLPVMIAGVLLFIHLLSTLARESFSPKLRNFSPLRTLVDHLYWYLPVIGNLERDRGLSDVCQALSSACRSSRPMDVAVAEAANLHMNSVLKEGIAEWAMGISAGAPLSAAAKDARLPGLVVQMIMPAQSSSDLSVTFDFLHRYYASRFSRTTILLNAVLIPLVTLIAGTFVLFTALAIFGPIVALSSSVSVKAPGGL